MTAANDVPGLEPIPRPDANAEEEDFFSDEPDADDEPRLRVDSESAQRCPAFGRGDHVELALALLERIECEGPEPVHDDGALYRYGAGSGLWAKVPEAEQSRIVQSFAGIQIKGTPLKVKSSDVNGAIKLAGHRVAQPDFFAGAPKGIAFADAFAVVSATGVRTAPHSPDNRARHGYPFPYDPSVPRQWLAFLQSLFRDDADHAERTAFIQEFFGACLLGIAPVHAKCLVSVGEGENGKSRLGEIIAAAMPKGSTTSVPPQLFENEYRRAMLAGKLLNFVAELPEAEILDSESFKAIVAGDEIQARPIREAPFDYKPTAGHYFAANRLPGSNDATHAFWRRFVVMPFTRTFREGDPDRDPEIHTKIIAAELPAIVPWLLEGGSRVMRSGYSIPPSHMAALKAWKLAADQVALFVHERMVPSRDARPSGVHDWTAASVVYASYRQWAEDAGHRPPLARNKFGARLVALGTPKQETLAGTFYALRTRQPGETMANHGEPMANFSPSLPCQKN